MNKSFLIIIMLAFTSVFVIQGCDTDSTEQDRGTSLIQTERDTHIANNELKADIESYKLEIENEIEENNRIIAEIKEEIQMKDSNTRDAYIVRVEDLERTNLNMKSQLDDYNHTTLVHWNGFKKDFGTAMDDLENSLDDFFSTTTTSIN